MNANAGVTAIALPVLSYRRAKNLNKRTVNSQVSNLLTLVRTASSKGITFYGDPALSDNFGIFVPP